MRADYIFADVTDVSGQDNTNACEGIFKYSFTDYEVSKKVMYLLRHSQHVHREEDGAVHFWRIKENHQNQFRIVLIGLTTSGRKAWQEEEETRTNTNTVLILQE